MIYDHVSSKRFDETFCRFFHSFHIPILITFSFFLTHFLKALHDTHKLFSTYHPYIRAQIINWVGAFLYKPAAVKKVGQYGNSSLHCLSFLKLVCVTDRLPAFLFVALQAFVTPLQRDWGLERYRDNVGWVLMWKECCRMVWVCVLAISQFICMFILPRTMTEPPFPLH